MVHDENTASPVDMLAADLQSRGYRTRTTDRGGPHRLTVSNPAASVLTEVVIFHADAFWWPWRQQIGPASDIPATAAVIARVLAAAGNPAT